MLSTERISPLLNPHRLFRCSLPLIPRVHRFTPITKFARLVMMPSLPEGLVSARNNHLTARVGSTLIRYVTFIRAESSLVLCVKSCVALRINKTMIMYFHYSFFLNLTSAIAYFFLLRPQAPGSVGSRSFGR
jgi:hypothetical protein